MDEYPSDEAIAAVQALVTKYGGEQVQEAFFKTDYYLDGLEREKAYRQSFITPEVVHQSVAIQTAYNAHFDTEGNIRGPNKP